MNGYQKFVLAADSSQSIVLDPSSSPLILETGHSMKSLIRLLIYIEKACVSVTLKKHSCRLVNLTHLFLTP